MRLSKKYKSEEEIKHYFLYHLIRDRKGYIANFNDENYNTWKLKRSNFFNMFVVEMTPLVKEFEPLFEVKKHNHPKLLKEFLGGRVSLETLIILDELVSFSKKWDKLLEDDIVWPDLKRFMNDYKRFLTIDKNKYRMNLLTLIEESRDGSC